MDWIRTKVKEYVKEDEEALHHTETLQFCITGDTALSRCPDGPGYLSSCQTEQC